MPDNWTLRGKVWLFEDNIDTDQILPGYAMAAPREKLKEYALAGSKQADFAKKVNPGDIVVAGKNFGCGSSREQAPVALKEAGVALVIARSFARIFRRNAINIGMPVLIADVFSKVQQGEEVEVDLKRGTVYIPGKDTTIQGQKLSGSVLETLEAGGLINKVRKQFGITSEEVGS